MNHQKKRKNSGLRFLCGLILFLTAISVIGTTYLSRRNLTLTFETVSLTESNEVLRNPYCGWYHTYEYIISEDTAFDPNTVTLAEVLDNSTRLCLLRIDLKAYANEPLSAYAISQIESILNCWDRTDKQVILRFCYDAVSLNQITEPSDISMVYRHMEQLSTTINAHASHIYLLQGAFLGSNGEPISSALLTQENLADLINYYASLTDSSLYLAAHDSSQYLTITGQTGIPDRKDSFQGTLPYRIGLFNDNLVVNQSEASRQAASLLGTFAPNGGSIGQDPALLDPDSLLSFLQQQHISYLNAEENAATLDNWKEQTYTADEVYNGVTLYDYITTHLGYRYVLTDAHILFNTWKNETASLKLDIDNKGFSNSYARYDVNILLRNTKTEEMLTLPIDTDNRLWDAGKEHSLSLSLPVRDYEKGTYQVYLILIDSASGEIIKLGNTMPMTSNGYMIGTLEIE